MVRFPIVLLVLAAPLAACDTQSIEDGLRSTERIRWLRRVGGAGFDEPQAVVVPSDGRACTWTVLDSTAPPAPGLQSGLHLILHEAAGRFEGVLPIDGLLEPVRPVAVRVDSDGQGRAVLGATVGGPDLVLGDLQLPAQGGVLEGLIVVDSTPRQCSGVPFGPDIESGWARRFGDRGAVEIGAVHFRGNRVLVAGEFTESFSLPLRVDGGAPVQVSKRGDPGDKDVFLLAFDGEGKLLPRSIRVLGGPGDDTLDASDLTPLGFQWFVAGRFEQELGVGDRVLFQGGQQADVWVARLTGLNLSPILATVEPIFSSGVADGAMAILSISAGDVSDGNGGFPDANFVFAGTLSAPRTLGGRAWVPRGSRDGYVFASSTQAGSLLGWLTGGSSAESTRSVALAPDGVWATGSFRGELPLGSEPPLIQSDGLGAYAVRLLARDGALVPVEGLGFGSGRTAGGPLAFISADEDLVMAGTLEGTVDFLDGSVESAGRSDLMLVRFGAPLPDGSLVFVP